MDYTVVVDSQGQTVTQGAGTDMMIRVTDAAGNSFWRPVAEVRGGPEAQADLGIELGPVVEATEGAQTVADTPERSTPTPEAAEAETDAEARSRRAEIRTQIAAANEYRRQTDWQREEAAYRAAEVVAEEEEQVQPEAGERDSKSVWLGPFGSFLGCAVWFWGPPLVFFPVKSILLACGYDTAALGVSVACGLTFWIGYLWFLSWQDKEEKRRAVRARLDEAAGTQQGGGAEA